MLQVPHHYANLVRLWSKQNASKNAICGYMTDPLPSIMYRCSRAIVRAVYTLGGPRKAFGRVDLEFGPFAPVELCKTPHAHGNVPWQEPPCAKLIVQHFKTQNFYVLPVNLPKMRGFAAHAD